MHKGLRFSKGLFLLKAATGRIDVSLIKYHQDNHYTSWRLLWVHLKTNCLLQRKHQAAGRIAAFQRFHSHEPEFKG